MDFFLCAAAFLVFLMPPHNNFTVDFLAGIVLAICAFNVGLSMGMSL